MADPKPLTLCAPAQIAFSQSGRAEATDYGDIYFSTDGGLEESRAVFIAACDLPRRWHNHDYNTVGELGFGTGLNFLATWQSWNQQRFQKKRLHYISVERHPLTKSQLETALSSWPELASLAQTLLSQWPGPVKGFHHLVFGNVSLTLIHDEILEGLSEIAGLIDSWYLDGFSPSKNPDMWSLPVMQEIARLSHSESRLGTFTVARMVRENLIAAGFDVFKRSGFGRKRDRLEAQSNSSNLKPPLPVCQPVIIGAGIAGTAIAHACHRRHIKAVIIDAGIEKAASGNPRALIKPRMDLQDRPESRFFLSSYLYALNFYEQFAAVEHQGIKHLCPTEKEQLRFEKLSTQKPLPENHFRATSDKSIFEFPLALVISPETARNQAIGDTPIICDEAIFMRDGQVLNPSERKIAIGSHVIWACGYGIRALPQFEALDLRYSRGQITKANATLDNAETYGGYILPFDDGALIGATHKRLDRLSPFLPRLEDDVENIEKLERYTGRSVKALPENSRSSVRVTTPSTLPMIINSEYGLGITGLGSRGFVFAPLLAEALVAEMCGEVLPVSKKLWTRFRAREKSNLEARPKKTPEVNQESSGG